MSRTSVHRALLLSISMLLGGQAYAGDESGHVTTFAGKFRADISPILSRHCVECHSGSEAEAGVILDRFPDDDELLRPQLWLKVLKNVRAGIMPPPPEKGLSADELKTVEAWIKEGPFRIDRRHPDPGHVTLRRLNRVEYRAVIRDLFDYDYNTTENFPPDDTGHGFDNIGNLLQTSPLLVEKYLRAANEIVLAAVPAATRAVNSRPLAPSDFFGAAKDRVSCQKPGRYAASVHLSDPGAYAIRAKLQVYGNAFPTVEKTVVRVSWSGEQIHSQTYAWQSQEDGIADLVEARRDLPAGDVEIAFEVDPLVGDGPKPKNVPLTFRLVSVDLDGPFDEARWVQPPNYARYFPRPAPPEGQAERRDYAREILKAFALRAYRRPVDEPTLDRLVELAERGSNVPGATFEQGIQQALTAILASRRFLYRFEQPARESSDERFPLLDEYALASRLSFLLWCSGPDDELLNLAGRGALRSHLDSQVARMLADVRSQRFVENFVGQWLRTREIDSVEIDTRLVLARDLNLEPQERAFREELNRRLLQRRREDEERSRRGEKDDPAKPQPSILELMTTKSPTLPTVQLDASLRAALRQETEACFAHVLRENRSLLELVDSDYTFLNEQLARHYGVEEVKGSEFRKVSLPADSVRGGLLAQAGLLMITSQPTRTSAVKRGVFVLENFLGTPAPPSPPNIPPLEDAKTETGETPRTLRETLELHRRNPVCSSCHRRMDPIGLALENFNALGMWRAEEGGVPLQIEGQLVTGEPLKSVDDLQKVLVGPRRRDYYRCLTEKLLIFALGRGLEYTDTAFVDAIVERVEQADGSSMALLMGVIESDAFQRCRSDRL